MEWGIYLIKQCMEWNLNIRDKISIFRMKLEYMKFQLEKLEMLSWTKAQNKFNWYI